MNQTEYRFNKPLENRDGKLHFDGVSAVDLAEAFDTPLYVIGESRIRENCRRLYTALTRNYKKIRVYYASKANTNLSVLKILEEEGTCLDAVSPGEVFMALTAGFTPERILFTGTSVRNDELKFLADSNIPVNVDSQSQLERLLKIRVPAIISVRVNPEVGAGHHDHCITAGKNSKFGLWENNAVKAYERAKEAGIERFGIHMHVGSGVLDATPFILAIDKLLSVAKRVHDEVGLSFEFVDMGGGIGVPYTPEDKPLDLDTLSEKVLSLFKRRVDEYDLGEPFFCVEPGRYLVCDASILLTRVNTVKVTPFKRYAGVDAGFNTLVRPTMYGSYHHVLVANKLDAPNEETYDVAGPVCESGDLLARDRWLPHIEEGDLLAILNAGAYGYAMSSQYNSRPRAAEVLVKDSKCAVIRERETLNDLMRGQQVAE